MLGTCVLENKTLIPDTKFDFFLLLSGEVPAPQAENRFLGSLKGLQIRPQYYVSTKSESIERFIEDQAFLRSYDSILAHPLPPSPVSNFFSLPGASGGLKEMSSILADQ